MCLKLAVMEDDGINKLGCVGAAKGATSLLLISAMIRATIFGEFEGFSSRCFCAKLPNNTRKSPLKWSQLVEGRRNRQWKICFSRKIVAFESRPRCQLSMTIIHNFLTAGRSRYQWRNIYFWNDDIGRCFSQQRECRVIKCACESLKNL